MTQSHSSSSSQWTRRNMIQVGLGGLASLGVGLSEAVGSDGGGGKSVILLWMAGGPSQIDTWDPKPERPVENRGPFGTTASSVPGIWLCEHLPLQAARMDQFTFIRSVDCRGSDHSPGKVMQTGNRAASPRRNPEGDLYPAIGSVVAKHHGPNRKGMPSYVSFQRDPAHVARGGFLGMRFDPMNGHRAAGLPEYHGFGRLNARAAEVSQAGRFSLPEGISEGRLRDRQRLLAQLNRLRSATDPQGAMDAIDYFQQRAMDMVLGDRARQAFDLSLEPKASRDRYGKHLWCRQALLARRLVEAGSSFVTIDLSLGVNAGDWDSHGDNHAFGGIETGLKPLLPVFDHLISTLVDDLHARGLLEDVLVVAMGEFGRTPFIGTQAGYRGGRNHWPRVMSVCLAGGGLRHGQVIGASDAEGGEIKERPVRPSDLAAVIYRHMGVPLNTTYLNTSGRPIYIVDAGAAPLRELY